MEEQTRLGKLQKLIIKKGYDGYLLSRPTDLLYLTGIKLEGSCAFITGRNAWLFVPELMLEHCRARAPWFSSVISGNPITELRRIIKKIKSGNSRKIYFDGETMSYAMGQKLQKLGMQSTDNITTRLRIIKSEKEIEALRHACHIARDAIKYAAKKFIKPGRTELEVVNAIDAYMRKEGAIKSSFDIIVAGGAHSSYPHHISSSSPLPKIGAVIIDLGCEYEGYCSDLTRTVFLGKISRLSGIVYNTVLRAQMTAIEKVRPGTKSSLVDRTARKVIEKAGFGRFFTHGTGHGVGLDIHEAPRVTKKSRETLAPGMVITVEPGIYLPGQFGVRIEDTILVTEKGHEVLTK